MYAALQECSTIRTTLGIGGWELSWATQLGGDWGDFRGKKKRDKPTSLVCRISANSPSTTSVGPTPLVCSKYGLTVQTALP